MFIQDKFEVYYSKFKDELCFRCSAKIFEHLTYRPSEEEISPRYELNIECEKCKLIHNLQIDEEFDEIYILADINDNNYDIWYNAYIFSNRKYYTTKIFDFNTFFNLRLEYIIPFNKLKKLGYFL